jgi:hypothetical protein
MNGAKMLRNILQFEKSHSAVTFDETDAAPCFCRAIDDLLLRNDTLKYGTRGQVNNVGRAGRGTFRPGIMRRTRGLRLAFRRTNPLTRCAADLFYGNPKIDLLGEIRAEGTIT